MQVLFIYGPAAAGKYTIGSMVSKQLGWPLFHNHLVVDAVQSLFEFGTPGFVKLRAKMWSASFAEAAAEQQSFVFTFNPENTVDPELLAHLFDLITAQGGQIHFVELWCDEHQLIDRMDSETRRQFGKLTNPNLYQQLKAKGCFEFPQFCEPDLIIDSGQLSAAESAQVIVNQIKGEV